MKRSLVHVTFVVILLFVPMLLRAQHDMVAVSAKRYIKVIQPMELTGKDLNTSRMYSMADAVRYYSGIQLKDYVGLAGFKTINVRSLGSERMRVFYNGIEISNPLNAQVDLSRFTMDNVGSLALYSGQKGDIFQSASDYASAGSLYITTQRPRFTDSTKTNFRASLRGASHYYINPSLLYEHNLGNYMSTSLSVSIDRSAGNYEFRYLRRNSAYHYTSDRGIPGPIVNNIWYRGEELSERNSFVQGNMKLDLSESYRTQLNFKFGYDYLHYENKDEHAATVDESFRQFEAYLSTSHLYKVYEDWVATGAYDLHFNNILKKDEQRFQEPLNYPRPWRLKHLGSLATQGSFYKIQCQASVLGTYVSNFERDASHQQYNDEYSLSPALLFAYSPLRYSRDRVFTIQAYVKQSFRVPSYSDRYISEIEGTQLKAENMLQYSLGVNYANRSDGMLRRYGLSTEVYFHDVTNKIIAYPNGSLYRWTMANLGRARIIGGDINLFSTARLLDDFDNPLEFTTKVQYTYQQARDITSPYDTYYKHQIPNIPWHSGSAILNVTWMGFALNYSFLYTGERYSRQENISYYKMQPWYTHDLSLMKQIPLGRWNLRTMLEVNNLLGQDYEIVANYPMPGRFFRVTIAAER